MLVGLLVLHNKKYSHHDIKPENIFLTHEISHEDFISINCNASPDIICRKLCLKLGDFGQTQREFHPTESESGEVHSDIMRGSHMYRPPEMIEGKAGSYPSDLFSVGVVM
jgi:serine/threonine protein kinase